MKRHFIGRKADGDRVYITARIDADGELHISGEAYGPRGPLSDSGCYAAGQIRDEVRLVVTFEAAWTAAKRDRLVEIWERWHLNHMRAGCQHQRAEGWDQRPIDPSRPLNAYGKFYKGQRYESWNMLSWVRPEEHPEGLMCKPCPECGYKYGSAWLKEELPADVVEFISAL